MSTTTVSLTTTETVRLPKPTQLKELKPLPVFDVSTATDERTKTLGSLLQKGHVTVAPLREPELILHSHLPHVGCSQFWTISAANWISNSKIAPWFGLRGWCRNRAVDRVLRA